MDFQVVHGRIGTDIWTNTRLRIIKKLIRDKGKTILDLGCGKGYMGKEFQKNNKVIFAEIDPELLKDVKGIKVILDAVNMPFKQGVFDYVICLAGNTMIMGSRPKEIKDINLSDSIMNSSGVEQKPIKFFKRVYDGELLKLKVLGLQEITITPEHPVLICNFKRIHRKNNKSYSKSVYEWVRTEPRWTPARMLEKNDYVVVPRNKIEKKYYLSLRIGKKGHNKFDARKYKKFEINRGIAWLLGLWTAEGSTTKYRINFHLGLHEKKLISRIVNIIEEEFGFKVDVRKHVYNNVVTVMFCNKDLASFLRENIGHSAFSKKIPLCIMNNSREIVRAYIQGLLEGDGNRNYNSFRITTISKELAHSLLELFYKIGITPALHIRKAKNKRNVILGRRCNIHDEYTIQFSVGMWRKLNGIGYKSKTFLNSRIDDSFVYLPIRSIRRFFDKIEVYNLETQDNTYCIPFIVHNCADVLEHIRDDRKVLRNIDRILKPKGKAIIALPAYSKLYGHHDKLLHHYKRYDKKQFIKIAKQIGFKIRYLRYSLSFLFLPFLINQIIVKSGKAYIGKSKIEKKILPLLNFIAFVESNIKLPFGINLVFVLEKLK